MVLAKEKERRRVDVLVKFLALEPAVDLLGFGEDRLSDDHGSAGRGVLDF